MKTPEKKPLPLTKTETVTLRLDPKKRFGLELLARKQYRSISSVIEWMLDGAIYSDENIANFDYIWDVDEADRLIKLALYEPNLLNFEEQKIWKIIKETGSFWKGKHNTQGYWSWSISIDTIIFEKVRKYFNIIVEIANGEGNLDDLPKSSFKPSTPVAAPKSSPPTASFDLDDEIPF